LSATARKNKATGQLMPVDMLATTSIALETWRFLQLTPFFCRNLFGLKPTLTFGHLKALLAWIEA